MNWYLESLKKYWDFEGRSRRTEYWMFQLFYVLLFVPIMILDAIISAMIGSGFIGLTIIYIVVMLVPNFSVSVRRLHDTNNSGWMLLITFIPLIGGIWLFVLNVTEGDKVQNKYGVNPKS